MMYPFMTLDDNAEIVHSEMGKDGRVKVYIEKPDEKDGFLLHPCVEINLRRTMGHVALSVPLFADGYARVMQIVLADKYRIRVRKA